MSEPMISIIYYKWYGGKGVSKKAIDLYNENAQIKPRIQNGNYL